MMDEPLPAPRGRAQTLHALRNLIESYVTIPLTVTVQTPFGTQVFDVPPLPYADAETAPPAWSGPPRFSPMELNLLEAAAASPEPLTGDELAKRSGYPAHAGVRTALASLRRSGYLGGVSGSPGYPITEAGRRAVSS